MLTLQEIIETLTNMSLLDRNREGVIKIAVHFAYQKGRIDAIAEYEGFAVAADNAQSELTPKAEEVLALPVYPDAALAAEMGEEVSF